MTGQDDELTALQRQLDAMPRELAPGRDLWPGIALRITPETTAMRRLSHRPRPAKWIRIPVALAAGYALAGVLPPPWAVPDAPGTVETVETLPVDLALVDSVRPALARLPAKTRSVVEADLSGLEHDRLAIEQALAMDPENVLLQELRMNVEDRAVSVVEQVNRLIRFEPPEDVEI